jgi:hypothetical protein
MYAVVNAIAAIPGNWMINREKESLTLNTGNKKHMPWFAAAAAHA